MITLYAHLLKAIMPKLFMPAIPWAAIAAMLPMVMDMFKGKSGGNSSAAGTYEGGGNLIDIPNFQEDALFRTNVQPVSELSLGLLEGNVPDYYKGIGESGSSSFENMLSRLKTGTINSVAEQLAAGNVARGGLLGTATADKIGDLESTLRYQDLLNSVEGKKYLLNTGMQGAEYAGSQGLNFSNMLNNFNLNQANLKLKDAELYNSLISQEEEGSGGFLGNIIGGVTDIVGGKIGAIKNLFSKKSNTADIFSSIGQLSPSQLNFQNLLNTKYTTPLLKSIGTLNS